MKNNQELQKVYLEFQILNQQVNQLKEQFNSINENINSLKKIEDSLDEIKRVKKDNKILIPLGNNIFIKGKIEKNNEIIIGVGSKTLVKKNLADTKDTIKNQINELNNINTQLEQEISNSILHIEELQKEIIQKSK